MLRSLYAASPLRFLAPRNEGTAAWVYLSSFGGGIVGGDELKIHVQVGAGAQGVLLSQSSTKVYRSDLESSQAVQATVEAGGVLYSLPDPLVCFERAKFSQSQSFDLAEDASLLLLDTITSGRQASGERWVFDRYRNRIQVRREGRELFHESLLLDSRAGAILDRIGRFNAISVVCMTGPKFRGHEEALLRAVAEERLSPRSDLVVTASPLSRDGLVLRIAGTSNEEVGNTVRRFLHFVPEELGDNPWARKN